MKKYEFQITCPNEKFCTSLQEEMSDYNNKDVRKKNTDHDHTASKKFDSWDSAIEESELLLERHSKIVSIKVVAK